MCQPVFPKLVSFYVVSLLTEPRKISVLLSEWIGVEKHAKWNLLEETFSTHEYSSKVAE